MKTRPILLPAVLLAMLGSIAWLSLENAELRRGLAESTPAPKKPPRPTTVISVPGTARPGPLTGNSASDGKFKTLTNSGTEATGLPANDQQPWPKIVTSNNRGDVIILDPQGGPGLTLNMEQARQLTQEIKSTLAAHTTKLPNGPSWSPGQAAGAPNTENHGDFSTAWASQSADGGPEWLKVKYQNPVEVREINIHESYNPGAIAKVSVILPDGGQKVIWEGVESAETGVIERSLAVPPGVRSDQILIELDTARVPGWNEIDAVEIVGQDGSRQWGAESTASSYYGEGNARNLGQTEELNLQLGTSFRSLSGGSPASRF